MADNQDPQLDQARARFLSLVDELAQGERLSPIAGRIFGVLVFDGGPIAFSDLADRLGVSRASVSTSARALEKQGLVRRIQPEGSRSVFFDLVPDGYAALIRDASIRARAGAYGVTTVLRDLPDGKTTADAERVARLRDFESFYDTVHRALERGLIDLTGEANEPTA